MKYSAENDACDADHDGGGGGGGGDGGGGDDAVRVVKYTGLAG